MFEGPGVRYTEKYLSRVKCMILMLAVQELDTRVVFISYPRLRTHSRWSIKSSNCTYVKQMCVRKQLNNGIMSKYTKSIKNILAVNEFFVITTIPQRLQVQPSVDSGLPWHVVLAFDVKTTCTRYKRLTRTQCDLYDS